MKIYRLRIDLQTFETDNETISHVCWAGALMEVRSLFGLNFAVWKKRETDGPRTDHVRTTDGPRTDPNIESLVRD